MEGNMCSSQLLKDYKVIERVSCVYKITHTSSTNFYIGRTNDLRRRAKEHHAKLSCNKHNNPRMQNLHNKYGDSWCIGVEFIGSVDECVAKEQELLDATDLTHSLNCHLSSVGGSVGTTPSKEKVIALLDWAVANSKTRDEALRQFNCSWDALKKYQPEWEAINGRLTLPLRASGERSGNFKHGRTKELRRKRTAEELAELNEKRKEKMAGSNNPMFGKTHTIEARAIQSKAAKEKALRNKEEGFEVSAEARAKISAALKGKAKPDGDGHRKAAKQLGKLYNTPFGIFNTSKECEQASGIKAATIMWRCKNTYLNEWGYAPLNQIKEVA